MRFDGYAKNNVERILGVTEKEKNVTGIRRRGVSVKHPIVLHRPKMSEKMQ